jgi:predicted dinucleotide-binding enzyme
MSKLTVLTVLVLLVATPAHAYLDPGTGSILVQALLAGLAVVSAAVATFWTRIRQVFTRRPRTDQPSKGDDHDAARP